MDPSALDARAPGMSQQHPMLRPQGLRVGANRSNIPPTKMENIPTKKKNIINNDHIKKKKKKKKISV